jgi:hypothetical protein
MSAYRSRFGKEPRLDLTLAYAPGSDLGFWTDIPNESGYYSAFDYLDVFQGFGRERDLRHP